MGSIAQAPQRRVLSLLSRPRLWNVPDQIENATGPWSEPVLVAGGKGLIDPCPLWDDDGQVYLLHAFAGSPARIKSVIVVKNK